MCGGTSGSVRTFSEHISFQPLIPIHGRSLAQPWIAYEWLGEVVLALLSRMGGVIALAVHSS